MGGQEVEKRLVPNRLTFPADILGNLIHRAI
jgi:hypothetical protein